MSTADPRGFGTNLVPAELRALAVYARTGSQKVAAYELGIRPQTLKNELCDAYRKLGAYGALEALAILGWLAIPNDLPRVRRRVA